MKVPASACLSPRLSWNKAASRRQEGPGRRRRNPAGKNASEPVGASEEKDGRNAEKKRRGGRAPGISPHSDAVSHFAGSWGQVVARDRPWEKCRLVGGTLGVLQAGSFFQPYPKRSLASLRSPPILSRSWAAFTASGLWRCALVSRSYRLKSSSSGKVCQDFSFLSIFVSSGRSGGKILTEETAYLRLTRGNRSQSP